MGDVPDETALPVDLLFDLSAMMPVALARQPIWSPRPSPTALRLMGESSESEL